MKIAEQTKIMDSEKPSKQGFTIIEVVLVLAITGLIFMMVFIGLPSLQRSQRNTQRRNDAGRITSALIEYQKHNHGRMPFTGTRTVNSVKYDTNFITRYVDSGCKYSRSEHTTGNAVFYYYTDCGESFIDPNGSIYNLVISSYVIEKHSEELTINPTPYFKKGTTMFIIPGTKCGSGEWKHHPTGNPNDFALMMELESAGTSSNNSNFYCVDNS